MRGQRPGGYSKLGPQSPGDCVVEIRARSSPLNDWLLTIQQSPLATHPWCPLPYPPQPGVLHRDFSEEEVDMVSMLQSVDKVWL